MRTVDDFENELISNYYGTPKSILLEQVREAGFKPIGITVMMCEETFIFKGKPEAQAAWEIFKPEGWWYGFGDWEDTRQEYVKQIYGGDEDDAPTIYWLDANFAPKEKNY